MVAFQFSFWVRGRVAWSPRRCRALHHGPYERILLFLYQSAYPYVLRGGKEGRQEQGALKDVNWIRS